MSVIDDQRRVETPLPSTAAPAVAGSTGKNTPANTGLANVLQAGLASLEADKTKEFPVPGWDVAKGQGLTVRARKIPESEREDADTPVKTIALATEAVLLQDENGEFKTVANGWRGVADLMGIPDESTSDVIRRVLDNGARLDDFSVRIMAWMLGRTSQLEQLLGE